MKGYAATPRDLLADQRLTGEAKLVYTILANFADKDGVCYPKHATIAAMTGWSVSTVKRSLVQLRDHGYVSWKPRTYGAVNEYLIALETPARETEGVVQGDLPPQVSETYRTTSVEPPKPKSAEASSAKVIPIRKPDPLWLALLDTFGYDETEMTKTAKTTLAVAMNQLKGVGAEPPDIPARLRRYRELHPTWTTSPMALVKHWHSLTTPAAASVPSYLSSTPQPAWDPGCPMDGPAPWEKTAAK